MAAKMVAKYILFFIFATCMSIAFKHIFAYSILLLVEYFDECDLFEEIQQREVNKLLNLCNVS